MTILAAENCYKKGLVALAEGRPAEATAMFEAAMVIERERSVSRPQMRYLILRTEPGAGQATEPRGHTTLQPPAEPMHSTGRPTAFILRA